MRGHARGNLKLEEISCVDKFVMQVHGDLDLAIHLLVEVGNSSKSRMYDDDTQDDVNPNPFIEVRAKHRKRNSPNGHKSTLASSGVKTRN